MNTNILNIRDAKPCFQAVMVYGHFSAIHPGHIRYLKYAKLLGKKLIVSLLGKVKILKIDITIHKMKEQSFKIVIFIRWNNFIRKRRIIWSNWKSKT